MADPKHTHIIELREILSYFLLNLFLLLTFTLFEMSIYYDEESKYFYFWLNLLLICYFKFNDQVAVSSGAILILYEGPKFFHSPFVIRDALSWYTYQNRAIGGVTASRHTRKSAHYYLGIMLFKDISFKDKESSYH